MQSLDFFFGIQLRVLVLRPTDNLLSSLQYTLMSTKLNKLPKYVFQHYKKDMRELGRGGG